MPVQPDGRSLHHNTPLTNLSTAYIQNTNRFIAAQVFPQVPVQHQGNLYWKYKRDDWFRSVAGLRAPATESPGSGWEVEQDSYFCHVYAVHKDLDDQTRANADNAFNLDRDAVNFVTMNLLLKRDRIFVDTYMKTGVWARDRAGVTGTPTGLQFKQWDQAGSDPVVDIQTEALQMEENTGGFRPNVLVIGARAFQALRNHASIMDRIKFTQPGGAMITEALLANLFGVDRIVIARTVENTAPEGAAFTPAFQSSKSALLCYSNPTPGLLQNSAGYIFTWTGLLGAGAFGTSLSRFRMEAIKSERIEGEMAFDMKVVASDLGTYWNAVVA